MKNTVLGILAVTLALVCIPFCHQALAVSLPYTFSSGTIKPSEVNANFSTLRDAINAHESQSNAHNTSLEDALLVDNSAGTTPIDFNLTQAIQFRVQNVASDPACNAGSLGRLIWNTVDELYKVCNGTSFVSIAGSGVNTLASVLSAGNSAGASNLNMNGNQIISIRVENRTSDPGAPAIGQMFYRSDTDELKVCDGAVCTALGGAQGLASVLSVSNATGGTAIDFEDTELLDAVAHKRASDPSGVEGKFYYNTGSNKLRFHNGSGWLEVGNTNTLAQTMVLGNSVGASDLDVNGNELINFRVENLAAPPGTGQVGRFWYDTVTDRVQYGTTGANKEVCSLDDVQVLTNKTISGASNTLTNIPDTALSANIGRNDTNQTVSGTKTFSAAPVMSRIKTSAGTTLGHQITNGLADDTFVLANAVQTLSGKTLNAPTLSGNLDFNLFQAIDMRLENFVGALPATNLSERGRMVWSVGANQPAISDGVTWKSIQIDAAQTWAQVLLEGNSAGATSPDFNLNESLNFVLENLGADPVAATAGRIWFNTADELPKVDLDGAVIDEFVLANGAQTLENKTIDADDNTISNIRDAEIAADADIARTKIVAGTADHVVINDGSGVLSSEAQLALSRGGTNKNMTASAGSVAYSDADSLELTAVGTSGQILQSAGAGTPAWTTATYPATTTANQLLYSSSNNVIAGLASANIAALITDGSGVPSLSASSADGQVLRRSAGALSFGALTAGELAPGAANSIIRTNAAGTLNEHISLLGTANQITVTNNASDITLSLPQNIHTTASPDFLNLYLSGSLSLLRRDENSAATVNDLDSSRSFVKLTATVSTINGIEAGVSGQVIKIFNDTGSPVTITHESGSAIAADQISLTGGIDLQLLAGASVEFIYDSADAKWVPSGGSGGGQSIVGNGSSGSPVAIDATGVAFSGFSGETVWYIEGDGDAIDITTNPQIGAGNLAHQKLILIGTNDVDTVLFEDGNGLSLNGSWTAYDKSVLGLIWDEDASLWVELFRR